jgi:hypothetical protein
MCTHYVHPPIRERAQQWRAVDMPRWMLGTDGNGVITIVRIVLGIVLLTVHWKFGLFMNWYSDQRGQRIEYHLLVLVLALVVMIKGGAPSSLDQVLYKHVSTQDGVTLGAGTGRGQ